MRKKDQAQEVPQSKNKAKRNSPTFDSALLDGVDLEERTVVILGEASEALRNAIYRVNPRKVLEYCAESQEERRKKRKSKKQGTESWGESLFSDKPELDVIVDADYFLWKAHLSTTKKKRREVTWLRRINRVLPEGGIYVTSVPLYEGNPLRPEVILRSLKGMISKELRGRLKGERLAVTEGEVAKIYLRDRNDYLTRVELGDPVLLEGFEQTRYREVPITLEQEDEREMIAVEKEAIRGLLQIAQTHLQRGVYRLLANNVWCTYDHFSRSPGVSKLMHAFLTLEKKDGLPVASENYDDYRKK